MPWQTLIRSIDPEGDVSRPLAWTSGRNRRSMSRTHRSYKRARQANSLGCFAAAVSTWARKPFDRARD